MTPRARALVIAAVLGLPATVYADTDDDIRSFTSSKYTYCDAKLLAALWKQSVADAKATIGHKAGSNPGAVDRALVDARKHAVKTRLRCSYQEAGLTYDDAERLAKLWKRSVTDAKAMIEQKLLTGGVESIRELLKQTPDHDELAVFLQQDRYTYCDAKMIAALWKQSIGEAKTYIGTKIAGNATAALERALAQARANARKTAAARCTFAETGFSYDDAAKLAKLWNTTEAQAKARVEDKVLAGNHRAVRALLGAPVGEADIAVFLKQSRYGYCDVKMLAALWKQSLRDAKATVGAKVKTKATAALDRALAAARTNARKNPAARCSFGDAFTYQDAVKLAKLWSITVADAKARVEAKLLAGGEEYVRDQLKTGGADENDLAVFLRQSRYTYCDAKMIASLWRQSIERSKAYIGGKLADRNTAAIDNTLAGARENAQKNPAARCRYHESGLGYDDAVKLAALWKISESDAKLRVETKIAAGGEAAVRKLLKR